MAVDNASQALSGASEYFRQISRLLSNLEVTDRLGMVLSLDKGVSAAVGRIVQLRATQRKAIVMGNGGSAAIASHMHNDLCKAVGVRSLVFHEAPLLTALSNDNGYGCAFARLVGLWADSDDLLIAISSSGASENMLCAAEEAVSKQCGVITISGFGAENPLRKMGDLNFYVPAQAYGLVETVHAVLTHLLTDNAMVGKRGIGLEQ